MIGPVNPDTMEALLTTHGPWPDSSPDEDEEDELANQEDDEEEELKRKDKDKDEDDYHSDDLSPVSGFAC